MAVWCVVPLTHSLTLDYPLWTVDHPSTVDEDGMADATATLLLRWTFVRSIVCSFVHSFVATFQPRQQRLALFVYLGGLNKQGSAR